MSAWSTAGEESLQIVSRRLPGVRHARARLSCIDR
jgi:hypothetical protein